MSGTVWLPGAGGFDDCSVKLSYRDAVYHLALNCKKKKELVTAY